MLYVLVSVIKNIFLLRAPQLNKIKQLCMDTCVCTDDSLTHRGELVRTHCVCFDT